MTQQNENQFAATSNGSVLSADRFTAIVARVFEQIEARGIDLADLGGQSVDEIAAELRAEFSSDGLSNNGSTHRE